MQKCVTCQYYDRKHAKAAAGSVAHSQQGQCRRTAPLLHPINPKSYLIEGVWPTVHDDDWCGEWKLVARRAEVRMNEASSATPLGGMQPAVPHVSRIAANLSAEPIKGPHIGSVRPATVKPFMPIAAKPAVVAPIEGMLEAAGTPSGDD